MATRKRKRTAAKRRRSSTITHKRRAVVRANPGHARRHTGRRTRRRRNPTLNVSNLIENFAFAGGGALATEYANGFLPSLGNPILEAGKKLGVAWGIGTVAQKFFKASPSHAEMITVGGGVSAVVGLFQLLIPQLGGFLGGRTQVRVAPNAQPRPAGMGDLVALPGMQYDPYFGSTPGYRAGMGGLVTARAY